MRLALRARRRQRELLAIPNSGGGTVLFDEAEEAVGVRYSSAGRLHSVGSPDR